MQLAPNKTSIEATVVQVMENTLKIVLLKIPDHTLPAFLWTGKIVSAKNQSTNIDAISEGDIISAEIEVRGGPFNQAYYLYNALKLTNSEGAL